jgi:hypothetical protein
MKKKFGLVLTRVIYEQAFVVIEASDALEALDAPNYMTFDNSRTAWIKTSDEKNIKAVFDDYGNQVKV